MDKRLFIAVMLSIAFLFAWGALVPRLFPELAKPKASPTAAKQPVPPRPKAPETATAMAPSPDRPAADTPPPLVSAKPEQAQSRNETVVETDEVIARFTNRGAQLISYKLKNYKQKGSDELVELVRPRTPESTDFPFALITTDAQLTRRLNEALYVVEGVTEKAEQRLAYRFTDESGLTMVKTFRFRRTEPYRFEFAVEASRNIPYRVTVGPGLRALQPEEMEDRFVRAGNAVIQVGGSFDTIAREKAPQFKVFEGMPDFAGLEDNYFLAVLQPVRSGSASFRAIQLDAPKGKPRSELYVGLNAVNGRIEGKAFFGPKESELLDRYELDLALQYGFFGFIARFLLVALKWLYTLTNNYGWAIVVLTIMIKIVLYPLQHKSIVSMKRMQRLQPRMNAIKEKYKKAKTDPEQRQKMNMEMMKLYQQEGINPMSGCLPILLQLPILWAFYSLLSVAIELRGAEFMLWIQDLSAKDPYYITPILMTITMFIQQWMTPTTVDPAQRRIFLAMPFIFGWIFKEFPSGLVLYWLVQNILSIVQQWIMNRYWKEHPES
jgi:YidC/Oxa1 family membrane protein insertase